MITFHSPPHSPDHNKPLARALTRPSPSLLRVNEKPENSLLPPPSPPACYAAFPLGGGRVLPLTLLMVFTPAKQTNKATSDDERRRLPLVVSTARGAAQPERERGKEGSIAPVSPHRIASNDDCSLFSDTPTRSNTARRGKRRQGGSFSFSRPFDHFGIPPLVHFVSVTYNQ